MNFTQLQNYTDEELCDMDYQLREKNEECYNHLQDLTKQYNEKQFALETDFEKKNYELETRHQRRIDELQHEFEEREKELSEAYAERTEQCIIPQLTVQTMKDTIDDLKSGREDYEKEANQRMQKELNARLATQTLQHQVDTSDMKARIENQEREIASLRETIESLKSEIQAQRELTREVANAGQKAVTQNFGK